MCIILDTNLYRDFINENNEDMKPVRVWMNHKGGKIAYSPVGKIKQELESYPKMKEKFEIYNEAGKLKVFPKEKVEREKKRLKGLTSDDPDIIALAKISNVKVLATKDKKLHTDFKEIIDKGKIYQNKDHEHLLEKDTCP